MGAKARIEGVIDADEVIIGEGVVVEAGVFIGDKTGRARQVRLGDYCFIGRDTRILVPSFCLGDYSKLHANSFLHGEQALQIGRNCWIGGNVVLDSMGGLDIDDNVGIGAQSQLWTHIQFGDIVEGCRFFSKQYMHVGKDAWFVGHCIVSPVTVGERSMALVGSVVTREMEPNKVYAGVPARDVTDKFGTQFQTRSREEKAAALHEILAVWSTHEPNFAREIDVILDQSQRRSDHAWFDVSTRTYNKRLTPAEVAFMQTHVPLVKFSPDGEPPFIHRPSTRN